MFVSLCHPSGKYNLAFPFLGSACSGKYACLIHSSQVLYGGVCKVNYLLRVPPVEVTKSGAQIFDKLVEKTLRHIVEGVLDTEIFRELQPPTDVKPNSQCPTPRLGLTQRQKQRSGSIVGHLTSATTKAAVAFLFSAASCNALVGNALGIRVPNELSTYIAAKTAYEAWSVQCKQESLLPCQASSSERSSKQKTVTALVHE